MTSGREEILRDCGEFLKSCIDLINEYADTDMKSSQIDVINNVQKSINDVDNEFKRSMKAIGKTKEYFNDENVDDTQKVENIYKDFLSKESQSIACANQSFAGAVEGNNSFNESVVLSHTPFQIPKDPLTKRYINDPCRNKVCGHVYEFDTIVGFIKMKKNKMKKCPYVGCTNNSLSLGDIEKDEHLKMQIRNSSFNVSNISM